MLISLCVHLFRNCCDDQALSREVESNINTSRWYLRSTRYTLHIVQYLGPSFYNIVMYFTLLFYVTFDSLKYTIYTYFIHGNIYVMYSHLFRAIRKYKLIQGSISLQYTIFSFFITDQYGLSVRLMNDYPLSLLLFPIYPCEKLNQYTQLAQIFWYKNISILPSNWQNISDFWDSHLYGKDPWIKWETFRSVYEV